jgi:basic membrane lipoprotein Med (substrate-binding protein (PBP1-ABC) superfamily)
MSNQFIKKNIKLSLEFDKYLSKHPAEFKKIPNKACIVITVKGDKEFNRSSLAIAQKVKQDSQKCIEARKEGSNWILEPFPA